VLPAFRVIDSDFPNYYVAARIVKEGDDPAKLYDDDWFQAKIHDHGIQQRGKFSPFPPPTAFLLLPLTGLSPLAALRVVTVLNLAMLASAVLLVSRVSCFNQLESCAFVLLSGAGLINCLRLGQLYIGVSAFTLLGVYLFKGRREWWAGACLALPVPFKYFPAIFIAYLGIRGRWRVIISSAIVLAGICGASVAILGWPVHAEFLRSVLPNHIRSNLSQQDPFSVAFQSFDSLLRRLFVFDPIRNPHPMADAYGIYLSLKTSLTFLLATLAGLGIWRVERSGGSRRSLSISLLGILALLIAPATATYHFVLLWLPVGLLLSYLRVSGNRGLFTLSLGLYAGIGLLPYTLFQTLAGPGLLTLAAYPRLWLTCALFITALAAALAETDL
jgi:hypothetical protein